MYDVDLTRKSIILICDGMADRRCLVLNGLTPLQFSKHPSFDWVASKGESGLMDPIAPGIPPGSDTAHLAILGYDPFKTYSGRGAFEALGAGIDLKPGDVAFRCNLATVNEDGIIIDRRAGRISSEDAKALIESLKSIKLERNSDIDILIEHTVEHRCVLILRGEGLSRFVSDVDPHRTGVRYNRPLPLDGTKEARKTADALEEFVEISRRVLESNELNARRKSMGLPMANILLPRGAGDLPNLESLTSKYKIKAAVIAGGAIYKGVCKAAGFDVINVKGATGTVDTDLDAKMSAALRAMSEYDLILVHVKATDSISHDRNPIKKANMISKIATSFSRILSEVDIHETCIVVTSDHTTSSELGEHTGDPVPVAIYAPDARSGNVERFDEVSVSKGTLGRIRGVDLMNILMNYMGRIEKFGE